MRKICSVLLQLVIVVLFFIPQSLSAEDSFVATLDHDEVSVEEVATLTLSLKTEEEKEVPLPSIPRIPGLLIFYKETRQVLSPQGGKVSPTKEFVYTLHPETVGPKTIPALGIHLEDHFLVTKPLLLNVLPQVSQPTREKRATSWTEDIGSRQDSLPPKSFARVVVDNPKPYQNEPIRVIVWAYATVPFQYKGLKEGTPPKEALQLREVEGDFVPHEETETKEGEIYYGRSVEEQIWVPLQSGPLTLAFGELSLLLKTEGRQLFDRSFKERLPAGDFWSHGEAVSLKVDPVSLQVRPLPDENRPDDFSGAVGEFKISTSLDKTELEIGESATLKLHIYGKGFLKEIKAPSLGKFPFASSFQSRASDRLTRGKTSFVGEKTYEMILITDRAGNFTLDPISFSYFNPKIHKYRRIVTRPVSLAIRERVATALAAPAGREKTEPELLGKDIYYIKSELGTLSTPSSPLFANSFFWGIQCVPLLFLLFSFLGRSYQLYLSRNVVAIRRRGAFSTSQARLKKAQLYLTAGRFQDCAREAHEAILGYLGDKWGVPMGALTLDQIEARVGTSGGDEVLQKNLKGCLETLQAIQFASGQFGEKELRASYELSKGVLQQLEKIDLSLL
ncbi:MAG: BatD family protein [Candidatus Omnitrophica bacterium]|nr:BatD family protein [Candidatus Omnitrophota bacterium]